MTRDNPWENTTSLLKKKKTEQDDDKVVRCDATMRRFHASARPTLPLGQSEAPPTRKAKAKAEGRGTTSPTSPLEKGEG